MFENKEVSVPATGTTGTLSGRCMIVGSESEDTVCNIVFQLDEGSVAIQGNYSFDDGVMRIVGATGCFRGLTGSVTADITDDELGFAYIWDISG